MHKQLDGRNVFLQDPVTNFHEAATRLYKEVGYEAHDFFQLIYITRTPAKLTLH